MPSQGDNLVPLGPPELCFDSRSFVMEHFSVDEFLQEHRNKANLETMRDDLGLYLKVLRSAMIDLINKDYADFVDLSSNLIGLDKGINRIQGPLGQLSEELLQVRQNLDGVMKEVTQQLTLRHALRERKRSLKSLSRVHSSLKKLNHLLGADSGAQLDPIILERATAEYVQLKYHLKRCQKDTTGNDLQEFDQIGGTLLSSIDHHFVEALGQREKGKTGLYLCLSLYDSLQKLDTAETLYRVKFIAPAMENLISESSLKSLPNGLPTLYNRIIEFVSTEMKTLVEVSQQYNSFIGAETCDFFLRSFWPEVEQRLETNLSSIFAAGDPNVFYKRYTETTDFLESLSKMCNAERFHSDSNLSNYMARWDLAVYFQLRFQEVVKEIESSLNDKTAQNSEWQLTSSDACWRTLMWCWSPGIYLKCIAHKFWKLSLQIISRYTIWCKGIVATRNKSIKNDADVLVSLYVDCERIVDKVPEFQSIAISKLPPVNEHTISLLKESIGVGESSLREVAVSVSTAIVTLLSTDSASYLKPVNEIPRLYRRTNREPPTKPCPYIVSLLDVLSEFHHRHKNHSKVMEWLKLTFCNVTKEYYAQVDFVLDSVKKTEESLRRLKKARDRTSNVFSNDRASDDGKIRHQLLLDVRYYAQGIKERFSVEPDTVEKLGELLLMVGSTEHIHTDKL